MWFFYSKFIHLLRLLSSSLFSSRQRNLSNKKIIIELYLTLGLDLLTDCGCSWEFMLAILVQVERINFYTTSNKNLYSVKVSPTLPSIRKHHPTESELPLQNYANENSCQSTSLPLVSLSINLAWWLQRPTRERSWEVCEALRTSHRLADAAAWWSSELILCLESFCAEFPSNSNSISHVSCWPHGSRQSLLTSLFFELCTPPRSVLKLKC